MADFSALLGSRATDPAEVRSDLDLAGVVDRLLPSDGPPPQERLARVVDDAAARRRLRPERLRALLLALASPPTAEINLSALARATGVPATTLPPYLGLLEDLGVILPLPGARAEVARRAVARPRAVWADPVLAAHLAAPLTAPADLLDQRGRRLLGALLHGAVARELLRQRAAGAPGRVAHLRERNGLEVDLLLELPDGGVVAVEVRTAGAFRPHQFSRIEALGARAGPRLRAGVVLLAAGAGHRYRPRLWTLPIASVWDGEGPFAPGLGPGA